MLKFICVLLFISSAFAEYPYSSDRLIVKIKKGTSFPKANHLSELKNLFENYYVAYSSDLKRLKKELLKQGNVLLIENDFKGEVGKLSPSITDSHQYVKRRNTTFNDPLVSSQWAMLNSEANGISVFRTYGERRSAPKEKIIVAVVDTGVDYRHPDLPMWTNEDEIPGNGIDDDQNGYVDDIHGINTLVRDENGNATSNMMDAHDHGTHVAGSIGAIQNNQIGIVGVASNVEIMGIRTVPNRSDETDVDVIEAFIYAAKNGAKVINCSFGKNHNEGGMAVRDAINHIGKEYGVLVIAAAGNSSRNIDYSPSYPASFDSENLLIVASTTRYGGMSYFSNYGPKGVDLASPGSSIYSSIRNGRFGQSFKK
jgi:hypothetical protein